MGNTSCGRRGLHCRSDRADLHGGWRAGQVARSRSTAIEMTDIRKRSKASNLFESGTAGPSLALCGIRSLQELGPSYGPVCRDVTTLRSLPVIGSYVTAI